LEIWSCFLPRPSWIVILLFYSSCLAGSNDGHHYAQLFLVEMGVSQTFLPELTWNFSLPDLRLPHSWDNRHIPPCPAIGWNGVSWSFFPGLFLSHNPPFISLPSS
jgi:hypothetical protein